MAGVICAQCGASKPWAVVCRDYDRKAYHFCSWRCWRAWDGRQSRRDTRGEATPVPYLLSGGVAISRSAFPANPAEGCAYAPAG